MRSRAVDWIPARRTRIGDWTLPPPLFLACTSFRAGNGGIARVARLTAKALATSGRWSEIEAISLLDDRPATDLGGVSVRAARSSTVRFALALARASVGHHRFVYDFSGLARAHPTVPGLRRPFIVWMHGIEVWEKARADRLRALRSANLVLCNSAYTQRRAERLHGPMKNVRTCWLATEQDAIPPDRDGVGPPTVLVVGRLEAFLNKGHNALLDAWPRVTSAVADARLLIVGTGPSLADLRERARRSPAAKNIDVRGFVPEEQMPAVWSSASVFAMPSRTDGFGLVYAEAMRWGLPVIASIHDAGGEVNVHGVTGYNVDLDRRSDLVERLVHLLREDALARELGRNAQARWNEHFSMGAFRSRFLDLTRDFFS